MRKTALVLMFISVFSAVIGFGREITLSYFYGATNISDAYLVSLTIPGTIFSFVGVGLSTSYIPLYTRIQSDKNIETADKFTSNLISFLIIIFTVIIILILSFTEPIVTLFAAGFDNKTLKLTVIFTRISIFGIYFSVLVSIFKSYLQLKNNYYIAAISTIPLNFSTILFIYLSHKYNVVLLAYGSVLAILIQFLFLIPFLYNRGFNYRFTFDINDQALKHMFFLAVPVMIGVSINQINVLVDRTVASFLEVGAITALNYANRLNGVVQAMFVMSLATAMYPLISKKAVKSDFNGVKKSLSESLTGINLFIMPIIVGTMIFSEPIVGMLFGRGAFDSNALTMTAKALFYYSFGMLGFGYREVLSRVFYSFQDTKTPMINASIAIVLNIILNIILARFLGVGGLALATSISAIIGSVLLMVSLRKIIGTIELKEMSKTLMKISFASIVMGGVSFLSYSRLIEINYINTDLSLVTSILIGALTYFIVIYFMKIRDVEIIITSFKSKFNKFLKT